LKIFYSLLLLLRELPFSPFSFEEPFRGGVFEWEKSDLLRRPFLFSIFYLPPFLLREVAVFCSKSLSTGEGINLVLPGCIPDVVPV